MRERGFTLPEVLVAVAVVVLMTTLVIAGMQAARPIAARSAAIQFDALVAYARSVAASSGNGATIVFRPRTDAGRSIPGFIARVYSGRPNGFAPMEVAQMAPLVSQADVSESTLGGPPLTLFFDSAGHATGMTGAADANSTIAREPACPGGTSLTFTLRDPRSSQTRVLACLQTAAGGPMPP